jgi:nucleotide-binding universal stress UspA family protein
MKTILAPIDFSPATRDVIAAASALARSFDGRVVLMNVTQPPVIYTGEEALFVNLAELIESTAGAALVQLEEIRDKLENDFVRADVIQLTGTPVKLIAEQAVKLGADYIVIGSHGHSAFYDLVVGSTTAGVMKQAPCPVVVVPPPARVAKRPATSIAEAVPS